MSSNSVFKRVVFFDFTGTLFDPFLNIRSILNSVAKEKGYMHFDNLELKNISKMPPIELLNKFSIPDNDKKVVVKEVLARLENEIQLIPPVLGIYQMLHKLRQKGCYLGILSSNTRENIIKWLKAYDLDFFHEILCVPFQETKTSFLEKIKNKFAHANGFFFISDEAKDLKQAYLAGFCPIGVAWGFDNTASLRQANPDVILSKPQELFELYFE